MVSSHGGCFLTNAMHHHRKNNLIKLTHYNETKKIAHKSQIVRAKENLKIVSENDQEIPQSQTEDNPMAPRGRAAQPSRDTRKTN